MGVRLRHSLTAFLVVTILAVMTYAVNRYVDHYGFIVAGSFLAIASLFRSLEDIERPRVKALVALSVLAAVWFTIMGSLTLFSR